MLPANFTRPIFLAMFSQCLSKNFKHLQEQTNVLRNFCKFRSGSGKGEKGGTKIMPLFKRFHAQFQD
uniref:Uncharacterized protein n=1 Tax=Megaselia scalaris TaxID=36166 RepID=T1GZP9_MEGSC